MDGGIDPALFSPGRLPELAMCWGQPRHSVDRFAMAIATSIDPEYAWVEVRDSDRPPDLDEDWLRSELGSGRFLAVERPDELVPDSAAASLGVFLAGRDERRIEASAELMDLLWLPAPLRDFVERRRGRPTFSAVVLSHAERLVPRFVHGPGDALRLLHVLRRARIALIATVASEPLDEYRPFFDAVFRIEGAEERPWRESRVIPEQVPEGSRFARNQPISLGAFAASRP